MNEELRAAILTALEGMAEGALEAIAEAAVAAVLDAGYFYGAGWEYAVRVGDRVVETGFNTAGQAEAWAVGKVDHSIQRRRVGVWEIVGDIP